MSLRAGNLKVRFLKRRSSSLLTGVCTFLLDKLKKGKPLPSDGINAAFKFQGERSHPGRYVRSEDALG
jgi:hypothetical protein